MRRPAVGGPAFDEDAFTFATSAVEALFDGAEPPATPVGIHWAGERLDGFPSDFGPLIGPPAPVRSHYPGPDGLLRAAAAAALEGGAAVVVATREGDRGRPGSPSAAGAVAVLVGPGPGSSVVPFPPPPDGTGTDVLTSALRWVGSERSPADGPTGPSRTAADRRPGPPLPTPVTVSEGAYVPRPRYLEGLASRWGLEAERCSQCGRVTFPKRGRCHACGRTDGLSPIRLPRDGGRIEAVTWIGAGGQPTEFDPQVESTGPYGVALVEFAPEVRATLQVTDCRPGGLRIGDPVRTVLRRLYAIDGEWRYGRKAAPLDPDA